MLDATTIGGGGLLRNDAKFNLVDGTISAEILNRDLMHVTGPTGKITADLTNEGELTLEGSNIFAGDEARTWINEKGGTITRTGPGATEIRHRLENRGRIEVDGGSLTCADRFFGGTAWTPGDSWKSTEIILRNGGKFILNAGDGVGSSMFSDTTNVVSAVSGGQFVIDSFSPVTVETYGRLVLEADAHWKRGAMGATTNFDIGAGVAVLQVGSDTGTGTLLIEGAEPLEMNGYNYAEFELEVAAGSLVTQNSGLTIGGDRVDFDISGIYRINGAAIWDSELPALPSVGYFMIQPGGLLVANGDCSVGDRLWLQVTRDGAVRVEANGSLSIQRIAGDTHDMAGTLASGSWTLGENATLDFNRGKPEPAGQILTIGNAAEVELSAGARLGNLPDVVGDFRHVGVLTLRGTTFSTSGEFLNLGTLILDGGTVAAAGGFDHFGFLEGDGVIDGEVVSGGKISPGSSPGSITVNGSFTQKAGGVLELELGGSAPGGDYDQLVINGTANLGGCLRLRSPGGSFPANGTAFTPLSATSLTGGFDEIITDLPSGRRLFEVVIGATEVTASAMTLDVSTYETWRAGVFSAAEQADEDVSGMWANPDGDELVNLMEYALDGNPKVGNRPLVSAAFGDVSAGVPQSVQFVFPWANGLSDVQYGLEYSTDLSAWHPLASQVVSAVNAGLTSTVTLSSALSAATGSQVFVRLVVSPM